MENNINVPKIEKEKNREPKIIEISGRRIVDVDNNEGALIESDSILFIDLKISAGEEDVFMKKYENLDGVTSHAYMGCAEVIGELSNGNRFYFHSRDPHSFNNFFEKILIIEKEKDADIKVSNIEIRGEFGRNVSNKEDEGRYSEDEKKEYKKICKSLDIDDKNIDIREESITGFSREKVVGYSWLEDKN